MEKAAQGKNCWPGFIHSRSPRAHRPFIAVNCAALPDGLLESELFGHERGAFTGAIMKKIGKFEMAHTGTLLLDEISEMNMGLQAKLLRVIQEREVDRVGGREPVSVNIRVIAMTNRSLYHEVEQGRFREDLYYRLNVFPITVPPLRERPADISLLARHFVTTSAARNGVPLPMVSAETYAMLQDRRWKGNVRELENVMERAVLVAGNGPILPGHLLRGVRWPAGDFLVSLHGATTIGKWVVVGNGAGPDIPNSGASEGESHPCSEGTGHQYSHLAE